MRTAILTATLLICTAAQAQEAGGIKGCIDSAISNGKLRLTRVQEGRGDVISRDEWVIRCDGAAGLSAWEQFYALRKDEPVEVVAPTGARTLVMKTGVGSRCTKLTRNPDGSPANKAVCDISLDLTPGFYQGALRQ